MTIKKFKSRADIGSESQCSASAADLGAQFIQLISILLSCFFVCCLYYRCLSCLIVKMFAVDFYFQLFFSPLPVAAPASSTPWFNLEKSRSCVATFSLFLIIRRHSIASRPRCVPGGYFYAAQTSPQHTDTRRGLEDEKKSRRSTRTREERREERRVTIAGQEVFLPENMAASRESVLVFPPFFGFSDVFPCPLPGWYLARRLFLPAKRPGRASRASWKFLAEPESRHSGSCSAECRKKTFSRRAAQHSPRWSIVFASRTHTPDSNASEKLRAKPKHSVSMVFCLHVDVILVVFFAARSKSRLLSPRSTSSVWCFSSFPPRKPDKAEPGVERERLA